VHDGVLAVYHQHILSLRIDPELDGGVNNRLVYEEAHPIPYDPKLNPHGNAYTTNKSVIEVSGGYDLDSKKNRVFMIENARKQNPVNGKNVAYKIQVPAFQPLLASPESFHYKRAEYVLSLCSIL
jgi:primary-amine oxidase